MLKFLVDESTGSKVAEKLKKMGFETVSVIEVMRGAEDEAVMRKAKEENRVILTNDKDFGWLATVHKLPGVILLRLREDTAENRIKITHHIPEKYRDNVYGSIIIATERRVRIKPV